MQIKRSIRTLLAAAALTGAVLIAAPTPQAHAAVFISVGYAPPAIPVYAQPVIPADGYVWTPGYWAYGPDGYYWVDGAWVEPPYDGALWTPGWWGYDDSAYVWYPGYWGPTVGYYGGINYGFGYFGVGFVGGYWNGGHFFYNTAYVHVPVGFRGVYARTYTGFEGHPGGPAFNAHPPAEFASRAAAYRASGVNGREDFRGNGSANGNPGAQPNRAPAAPAGNYNRGGSAPAPQHSAPSSNGNRGGGGSEEHGHR
jgi:WXXGXW repeat (2 copies)